MGDRGSIRVCDHLAEMPGRTRATLFRHWGGSPESMADLVKRARDRIVAGVTEGDRQYMKSKGRKAFDAEGTPYGRGRKDTVLALLTAEAVNSDGFSAYLGDDPYDGDNSDNGEYVLHTANAGWVLTHGDDIVASWGFRAKKSEAGKTLTAIAEGSALGPGFGPCPRDDWEMERRERDAHYDPPDGWKRPVVTPPPDLEPEALQVAVFCAVADAVKAAGGHDLSLRFMCRSNSCQTDAERVAVAREWADLAGWPGVEA